MHAAFNILGYRSFHSVLFFANIRETELWNEALDAKFFSKGRKFARADWDQVLGDYSAVSADPPAVAFGEDLIAAYPEAKVVLVEREIEAWFCSFDATIIASFWDRTMNLVADIDPFLVGALRACHGRWVRGWMGARSKEEMREKARETYTAHYALIRRVTPKERLLEYKLGDGWEPLCQFLGKPMPDVPFPNVNDSDAIREMLAIMMWKGLWNMAKRIFLFCLPCAVGVLGWWLYSRG